MVEKVKCSRDLDNSRAYRLRSRRDQQMSLRRVSREEKKTKGQWSPRSQVKSGLREEGD